MIASLEQDFGHLPYLSQERDLRQQNIVRARKRSDQAGFAKLVRPVNAILSRRPRDVSQNVPQPFMGFWTFRFESLREPPGRALLAIFVDELRPWRNEDHRRWRTIHGLNTFTEKARKVNVVVRRPFEKRGAR